MLPFVFATLGGYRRRDSYYRSVISFLVLIAIIWLIARVIRGHSFSFASGEAISYDKRSDLGAILNLTRHAGVKRVSIVDCPIQRVELPPAIEELKLADCAQLDPELDLRGYGSLRVVNVSMTPIRLLYVPPSVETFMAAFCRDLEHIDLRHCRNLREAILGPSIVRLQLPPSITVLDIMQCRALEKAQDFTRYPALRHLDISYTAITPKLPLSIEEFKATSCPSIAANISLARFRNLKKIDLGSTKVVAPKFPLGVEELSLGVCTELQMDYDFSRYTNLKILKIPHTSVFMPKLPAGIEVVDFTDCTFMLNVIDLSPYEELREVHAKPRFSEQSGLQVLFVSPLQAARIRSKDLRITVPAGTEILTREP